MIILQISLGAVSFCKVCEAACIPKYRGVFHLGLLWVLWHPLAHVGHLRQWHLQQKRWLWTNTQSHTTVDKMQPEQPTTTGLLLTLTYGSYLLFDLWQWKMFLLLPWSPFSPFTPSLPSRPGAPLCPGSPGIPGYPHMQPPPLTSSSNTSTGAKASRNHRNGVVTIVTDTSPNPTSKHSHWRLKV